MAGILHGARSVIFLYASCAPCYDLRRKYRTAKKSKKERATKEALIAAQPNLYHHPSPMQTNPFWAEEIEAGPNFTKGNKPRSGPENQDGTRGSSKEKLNRKAASSGSLVKKGQGSDRNLTLACGCSVTPSSPTVMGDSVSVLETSQAQVDTDGLNWNHKRYQREDEGLWGIDIRVDRLMAGQRFVIDALSSAGTTVSNTLSTTIRNMEGLIPKFSDEVKEKREARHPYYVGRNPPVNDLHPPIVTTTPYDTESMKWMLQPPPAVSIMNGKEKPSCEKNRSRTNSRASTLAPGTPVPMARIERQLTGGTIPKIERQLTGGAMPRIDKGRTTEEERKNLDGSVWKTVQRSPRIERQLTWTGEETGAERIRNGRLELTRIQTA